MAFEDRVVRRPVPWRPGPDLPLDPSGPPLPLPPVRRTPARGERRGTAVLVPPWKIRSTAALRGWVRPLAAAGFEVWMPVPPLHLERTPPGERRGEGVVGPDLEADPRGSRHGDSRGSRLPAERREGRWPGGARRSLAGRSRGGMGGHRAGAGRRSGAGGASGRPGRGLPGDRHRPALRRAGRAGGRSGAGRGGAGSAPRPGSRRSAGPRRRAGCSSPAERTTPSRWAGLPCSHAAGTCRSASTRAGT